MKRESWPDSLWRDVIGLVSHGLAAVSALAPGLTKALAQVTPLFTHGARGLFAHFRSGAQYISRHTGIPAVFVAAALIVVTWRMAKRVAHVALEVCVVAVLLLALTKLGVVSW